MSEQPVTVRAANWTSESHKIKRVRLEVFVEEQGVPYELDFDDLDATAWHFLALVKDLPVGTSRLVSTGQIGRMAVLPAYRRQGIGKLLLSCTLNLAHSLGISNIHLQAQVNAIDFYLANDFVICGEEFEEAGICHRKMRYRPLQ